MFEHGGAGSVLKKSPSTSPMAKELGHQEITCKDKKVRGGGRFEKRLFGSMSEFTGAIRANYRRPKGDDPSRCKLMNASGQEDRLV